MSRGHDRERAVKAILEQGDWFVTRAAGSFGDADLVALKAGRTPLLIEVKSSSTQRGPFADFGPQSRAELLLAARIAGARAVLCWWPPRGTRHWLYEDQGDWPPTPALPITEAAA
jgi:Holliday junction resolvase